VCVYYAYHYPNPEISAKSALTRCGPGRFFIPYQERRQIVFTNNHWLRIAKLPEPFSPFPIRLPQLGLFFHSPRSRAPVGSFFSKVASLRCRPELGLFFQQQLQRPDSLPIWVRFFNCRPNPETGFVFEKIPNPQSSACFGFFFSKPDITSQTASKPQYLKLRQNWLRFFTSLRRQQPCGQSRRYNGYFPCV